MGDLDLKPVFCMYDFRTKQQYIFRTNRVRECIGASSLITWAYEGFLKHLEEKKQWKIQRNYTFEKGLYVNDEEAPFHPLNASEWIINSPEGPQRYRGRVIYVGGGSLYMMWENRDAAIEANRELCLFLRVNTYGLSAVCGMAEVKDLYSKDYRAVRNDYERVKATAPSFMPSAMLPFTLVDRKTTLPITSKQSLSRKEQEETPLSRESELKLAMYRKLGAPPEGEVTDFDRIVTGKGTESLLAVIHIDGNNMGALVEKKMNPADGSLTDYHTAVQRIRSLSNTIQRCFVSEPLQAIREMIQGKPEGQNEFRTIIAGGDDLTIVCNARVALDVVETYFRKLNESNSAQEENEEVRSACAGICIFHSHFPFSRAYDLAEECCASAKKRNRRYGGNNMMVDFQHCFGGAAGDLESIRANDKEEKMQRPFCFDPATLNEEGKKSVFSLEDYWQAGRTFAKLGRANVKHLAELNLSEKHLLGMELKRLEALTGVRISDKDMKLLHDVAQMYDLWFGKEIA